MSEIKQGNFNEEGKDHRGWVIGHFMPEESLFTINDFELKWGRHLAGEEKTNVAVNSVAKTVSFLIYGEFKIIFPLENREVVLSEEGDYVFFDSGVPHTWKTNKDTLLLTLRWPSLANDQKAIS